MSSYSIITFNSLLIEMFLETLADAFVSYDAPDVLFFQFSFNRDVL